MVTNYYTAKPEVHEWIKRKGMIDRVIELPWHNTEYMRIRTLTEHEASMLILKGYLVIKR